MDENEASGAAPAVQDYYPDDAAHCYGGGAKNAAGYQLKTRWEEGSRTDTLTHFTPRAADDRHARIRLRWHR